MTHGAVAGRLATTSRPYTRPAAFRKAHPRDHDFFLLMVGLVWLGVVMGFGSHMLRRHRAHAPAFPAIVDVHAVVFVGWLCVLTAQLLLVRVGRTDLHRRLGKAAAVLFAVLPLLGVITAIVVDRLPPGTPATNSPFIAIQLADLTSFTVLGITALLLRRVPQAHKRLIVLAAVFIADAGFARWWAPGLNHFFTAASLAWVSPFWKQYVASYLDGPLLVGLMAAYDWRTRGRLHPMFVFGAAFGLTLQLVAIWVYQSAWWAPVAAAVVRM